MSQQNAPAADMEMGSLELTEQLIRERAYFYYEQRGHTNGHDMEDWLRAETEIFGKKPLALQEVQREPERIEPKAARRAVAA